MSLTPPLWLTSLQNVTSRHLWVWCLICLKFECLWQYLQHCYIFTNVPPCFLVITVWCILLYCLLDSHAYYSTQFAYWWHLVSWVGHHSWIHAQTQIPLWILIENMPDAIFYLVFFSPFLSIQWLTVSLRLRSVAHYHLHLHNYSQIMMISLVLDLVAASVICLCSFGSFSSYLLYCSCCCAAI